MEKWIIRNRKVDLDKVSKETGSSKFICKLLSNRNITDADKIKDFLFPKIEELHSPYELKDMDKAVKIIIEKINSKKKIRITGDYDCDGVISTFILITAFRRLNADVDFVIPDRIVDGYGININIIDKAINDKIDTIITCDNGIAAVEQIKYAKENGVTVIVTDHHDIPSEKVMADAVINPKQMECNYPFDKICGAVVALKLVQALYKEFNIPDSEHYKLIQYAAIATVCDVVDLVDENRAIVKIGLDQIKNTKNKGLLKLIKEAGLEGKEITTYSLGFVIGPCINATGRLDTAVKGVELLLEEDEDKASKLAKELVELNSERKDMTAEGVEQTIEIIETTPIKNDKVFVIYNKNIHESIAGIVAGRIKERYNVPTIVLTKSEKGVKGSARSIEEYNMFLELNKCKSLLTKFGGHPMAAGLSLEEEDINALRLKLNENTTLTHEDLIPKVYIDMAVDFKSISYRLIDEIAKLEPYGKANPKPLFGVKNVSVLGARILGKNNNVLKLKLSKENIAIDCIYFGEIDDFIDTVTQNYGKDQYDRMINGKISRIKLDMVYYPDINEYNGYKSLQIVMQKYRVSK